MNKLLPSLGFLTAMNACAPHHQEVDPYMVPRMHMENTQKALGIVFEEVQKCDPNAEKMGHPMGWTALFMPEMAQTVTYSTDVNLDCLDKAVGISVRRVGEEVSNVCTVRSFARSCDSNGENCVGLNAVNVVCYRVPLHFYEE